MGFDRTTNFKPSTKKQLKRYTRKAKEKEKFKPKKVAAEDLHKRMLAQVKDVAFKKLLLGKPSKTVAARGSQFLNKYFKLLLDKRETQAKALILEPKSKFMTPVRVPKLDVTQGGQFCYEVEGLWHAFSWHDLQELFMVLLNKPSMVSEPSTAAELAKRALRQVLGVVSTKTGFDLVSPKATLKIWEPLRSDLVKKFKKFSKELPEATDKPKGKKSKRIEVVEAEEEIPTKPKRSKKEKIKKATKSERSDAAKPSKKEKLNNRSEKPGRLPNLTDKNVLKLAGKKKYKKGMGEVQALIPENGISVRKFYERADKKKLDVKRTQIYLSVMRRAGDVTVH